MVSILKKVDSKSELYRTHSNLEQSKTEKKNSRYIKKNVLALYKVRKHFDCIVVSHPISLSIRESIDLCMFEYCWPQIRFSTVSSSSFFPLILLLIIHEHGYDFSVVPSNKYCLFVVCHEHLFLEIVSLFVFLVGVVSISLFIFFFDFCFFIGILQIHRLE